MPTPISWGLLPPPAPSTAPIAPPPSTAAPAIPCPTYQLPAAFFLAMFDRIFPQSYLAPLISPGPGYELLEGYAYVASRVSLAVQNLGCDSFFLTATGGAYATGVVQLQRPQALTQGIPITGQSGHTAATISGASTGNIRVTGMSGFTPGSVGNQVQLSGAGNLDNDGIFEIAAYVDAYTVDLANPNGVVGDPDNGAIIWEELETTVVVLAGTIVTTSNGGRDFLTTEDVTFNQSDVGPFNVPVQAVAQGYEWNVPGTVLTAANVVLPGDIDTIKSLMENPALGDLSITVSQVAPTTGGMDPALDQLGADRGIPREQGEPDSAYRVRIRVLPDTISPDSFTRKGLSTFQPVGGSFEYIETYFASYQTCWDSPRTSISTSGYDPNLFVFDDPRPPVPFLNRWLDDNDYRGGNIIVCENIQPIRDNGFWCDDTAENVNDAASSAIPNPPAGPGGARALCAYDVPDSGTNNPAMIQGAWDDAVTTRSLDSPWNGLYSGLYNSLAQMKPAGSIVDVELAGQ